MSNSKSEDTSAEQMKAATADQFDPWADRVLDAASLTDVFGGH